MICLDSNCIIDFLKGKKEAITIIEQYKEELVTTEICIFEVFLGIYKKQHTSLREETIANTLLNSLYILHSKDFGIYASKLYSELMTKGILIEQNDCFIASIMLMNGCDTIITRNVKHFARIPGIKIIEY